MRKSLLNSSDSVYFITSNKSITFLFPLCFLQFHEVCKNKLLQECPPVLEHYRQTVIMVNFTEELLCQTDSKLLGDDGWISDPVANILYCTSSTFRKLNPVDNSAILLMSASSDKF